MKKYMIVYFKCYDSYEKDTFVDSSVVPTTWSVERLNTYGFWVNEAMQITEDTKDAKYWVAPASIIGVSKEIQE